MFKISAVIMTTAMFAGLLASGSSGLTVAETAAQVAAVKVRTFVVHESAGVAPVAQFELPRISRLTRTHYLRRPSVASKVRTMRGA